jgi:hypothetical protein
MLTVDRLKRDENVLGLQVMRDQSTQDGSPAARLPRENSA